MSVTFIEHYAGRPKVPKLHQACFAPICTSAYVYGPKGEWTGEMKPLIMPDAVTYIARVDKSIDRALATRWVRFLTRLFRQNGISIVTGRVIDYDPVVYKDCPPIGGSYAPKVPPSLIIEWSVFTKLAHRPEMLLYLTACRMVDEYSAVVVKWGEWAAANRRATTDQLFARLQELHLEWNEGEHTPPYGFNGHGLMSPKVREGKKGSEYGAYGSYAYGPITIRQLHTHLQRGAATVMDHFTPKPKLLDGSTL